MTLPTAPPTQPRDPEEVELLLQFVRERDVHCPRCDYNLRNLTQPVCPECREPLHLAVGLGRPKFGWLIAAIAPGIFSGIAALFLSVPITLSAVLGSGGPPWPIFVVDGFGWLSGFFALGLFVTRFRFLRQPFGKQVTFAVIIWSVHVAAFIMLLVASRYF
jgi:hypothetical protein